MLDSLKEAFEKYIKANNHIDVIKWTNGYPSCYECPEIGLQFEAFQEAWNIAKPNRVLYESALYAWRVVHEVSIILDRRLIEGIIAKGEPQETNFAELMSRMDSTLEKCSKACSLAEGKLGRALDSVQEHLNLSKEMLEVLEKHHTWQLQYEKSYPNSGLCIRSDRLLKSGSWNGATDEEVSQSILKERKEYK